MIQVFAVLYHRENRYEVSKTHIVFNIAFLDFKYYIYRTRKKDQQKVHVRQFGPVDDINKWYFRIFFRKCQWHTFMKKIYKINIYRFCCDKLKGRLKQFEEVNILVSKLFKMVTCIFKISAISLYNEYAYKSQTELTPYRDI